MQKNAAIGNAAALNATGVTLCPGGGIYIEGNVDEMALSTSGTNNTNQVITVTQGTTVQRVTINPTTGQTTLESSSRIGPGNDAKHALTSTTNGVSMSTATSARRAIPRPAGCTGQVADNQLDASGNLTHNNALTIATPQTDNCNLDGSVTYNTSRQVAKDASAATRSTLMSTATRTSDPGQRHADVTSPKTRTPTSRPKPGHWALISNNVLVTEDGFVAAMPLNNFEMDGTVLASGIYDADHFGSRPVGLWENMGGYLSSTVGTFGVFSNSLAADQRL